MNWKVQAPKRPWLPAPWRGARGRGTLMDERWERWGGMGNEGMSFFFFRKRVKLNQVSWWFYMMYPEKNKASWICSICALFFFWISWFKLESGAQAWRTRCAYCCCFGGLKLYTLDFFGEDLGRLVWFMLRLGCFFWRFPNLIQDKPWKKSLDRTTFLVVKVWRIPFLQKGNMHFPGKLLWLRSQQKHPDLAAGLWEMIAKITPTKTKMSLKMGPFQKVSSLPTTIFQGTC